MSLINPRRACAERVTVVISCVCTVYGKKPSRLMKRNGTGRLMKRNGPFTIRSSSVRGPCVFAVRFESVLIKYYYIRTALSALARGSLWFLLKSATRSLNHALSLRNFFLLFLATLSQNCKAGHGFRLGLDFFTRAGVRRYLNSNASNF